MFVASFPGAEFSEALSGLAAGGGGAVRWVSPERIHLTYAFLGERAGFEREAGFLAGAVTASAGPFTVEAAGLGAFPSLENPKVLWLGAGAGAVRLGEIAEAVSGLLPPAERRPFVPHFTLGRVCGRLPDGFLPRLAAAAGQLRAASEIKSVDLVASEPGVSGNEYRVVYSKKLL